MSSIIFARSALRTTKTIRAAASPASSRYNGTSTMHDNDPVVLDREKARNLSQSQHKTSTPHDHAPGWNESLASASEAHIKADKSTASLSEMQSTTVDYIHSRYSPEERISARESRTMKDEVQGPLGQPRDSVTGPLSDAEGVEHNTETNGDVSRMVTRKKVHDETTKIFSNRPT